MNKNELHTLIEMYSHERSKKNTEALEVFLEDCLKNNPFDTYLWVKLALTVYHRPLFDDLKAIACLEKILEYDPHNVKITLVLIYMVSNCKFFDDELFERLCKLQTQDKALLSLIEYTKSWYYLDEKNDEMYEQCLINSINLCSEYLWSYVDLGQFYLQKGNLIKGHELMKEGLKKLEYVFEEKPAKDILNLEEFLNERFKGIHLGKSNYNIILESFDPKSPWITCDFLTKISRDTTEN